MDLSKAFLGKLRAVETIISKERGELSLFGLFLRESAPDVWDLVVAGPWVQSDDYDLLRYIAGLLRNSLTRDEMSRVSRIVLLEASHPGVRAINRLIRAQHEDPTLQEGNTVFGIPITAGYVVTSQRL
jgi:hypothetical protein